MSEPRNLGEALREADWEHLLPTLVAHAEWKLRRVGWAAGEDTEPSAASVQVVVNTAVERCLAGRRTWTDSCPDLETLLKDVIDSVVWNAKKAAIRNKANPEPDAGADTATELPSAEDTLVAKEGRAAICAAFQACAEGDPQLTDLYLAVLDGTVKRRELAAALNWTVEEVSAARIKLKRCLLSRFPKLFPSAQTRRSS